MNVQTSKMQCIPTKSTRRACVYCGGDVERMIDVPVHKDKYQPFCSEDCAVSFCRYSIGLLGIEQQLTYMRHTYGSQIGDIRLRKPTHTYANTAMIHVDKENHTEQEVHGQKRVRGIYDEFLQQRIGHNVHDFFSLDSLL